MARQGSYQQKGDIIDYLNTGSSPISAGQVVPLGTRIGFASADIAPGTIGAVAVTGVFSSVPAENAVVFAVGDILYWDETTNNLTKTATDNVPTGGWCVAPKTLSGTVATVKLVG